MDIRAILLLGGRSSLAADCSSHDESVAGFPLALCHVLGASVLDHTVERLKRAGITSVVVLMDSSSQNGHPLRVPADVSLEKVSADVFWNAALARFDNVAPSADAVIVQRLGPYAEIDYENLVRQHRDSRNRVTTALSSDGTELDCFVLSSSRRSDAAHLFKNRLSTPNSPVFVSEGYWSHLRSCADLRKLAMDAFAQRNSIRPKGFEIKPGVWLGEGARLHHEARVLAPAFVGARARVHGAAVLTRGAVVEHHCVVDCGTVLEGASVLPYTYLGAGLEFINCVIGFSRVAHLGHGVSIAIDDPRLVASKNMSPMVRSLSSAWALLTYLPVEIARGLRREPMPRPVPCTLAETAEPPVPALNIARKKQNEPVIPSLAPELARRYGNE